MTHSRLTGLYRTLVAGAALAAVATAAQAAPAPKTEAILAAVDAPLSSVKVIGRKRTYEMDPLLDSSSASSCAFNAGGGGSVSDAQRYREGLAHIGARAGARYSDYGAHSGFGAFGGASRFFERAAGYSSYSNIGFNGGYLSGPFGSTGFGGYGSSGSIFDAGALEFGSRPIYSARDCMLSDYTFAAARAKIARGDKTLPQAYALYEADQYDQALAMFERAYAKLPDHGGGVDAALMIGRIYIERAGNPADVPQAVTWLKKAATATYPRYTPVFNPQNPYDNVLPAAEASAILGKIYLVGYGVPRDSTEAIKWFKRAERHGHVPAAKILGDIYYNGYGVPQDTARAQDYYSDAARRGLAAAQFSLGEISYFGANGVAPNPQKAMTLYKQAAQVGQPEALYALAYAYDGGDTVARDPQKAIVLYKEAALRGNAAAQSALGVYFYKGEQVPADYAIARGWFESAARQGDADAMFNLAAMQSRGEGGQKDMAKALAWLHVAKTAGHSRATQGIASLEGRMTVADRRAASDLIRPRTAD